MNQKLTSIIIDDEIEAIELLNIHLAQFENVQVLGKYTNPEEGFLNISKLNPNIVFMDIEMPQHNGFDLVQCIKSLKRVPKVVFVTGYDKYLESITPSNSLQILLKPIDPIKLKKVIEDFQYNVVNDGSELEKVFSGIKQHNRLLVPTQNGTIYLKFQDIVFLKSDGNYTVITTQDGKETISAYTLKRFEEKLPKELFIRCHSSNLINTDYIFKIDKKKKCCTLSAG
ncbi:MAG: response regulator transcription factor [Salinivirgaceae bacterium]|nr:response regulator transcription factor [Salinivirgaceae bacterium]